MIVDLERYSLSKKLVQDWFLSQKIKDINSAVPILACSTLIPCIVIAFYIGEVDGWSPEILRKIKVLTEFYGYKEIINKPAGYPGL